MSTTIAEHAAAVAALLSSVATRERTLSLAPGEVARITLRIADPNRNDNASVGGATIDPVFFPTNSGQGGVLTPFVTQQAINTTSIGAGGTITRYPASVFFVQQPTTTPVGFAMAPPVSVQVPVSTSQRAKCVRETSSGLPT